MGMSFRGLSLVMLAALPLGANAGDTIKVARVVPYMRDISDTNLHKCDWNRNLPGLISWKSGRTVEVTDADLATVEGKVLSLIPLRNRRTTPEGVELQTRITEGMTQYRCDGRTGYGMSEYLDQIVDGQPSGRSAGF